MLLSAYIKNVITFLSVVHKEEYLFLKDIYKHKLSVGYNFTLTYKTNSIKDDT